ncbi:cytochrome P450 [Aspergillus alliaceus]|uniref:cytochrome P450 n=1 Tax=Petromyces alliaceus TaxID=209559 RepID=UPI0012A51133|nr:cytochrome P450 [Aspergillus alliaceus]KAB8236941.1 cytochrome P450 [Aspergillus alliaceus]
MFENIPTVLRDIATSLTGQGLFTFFGLSLFILLCPWFGYLRLPSSMRWWPSKPSGPLSALRLSLKGYIGSKSSEEGYRQISSQGQPFALCNPSFYPQVLLPPEHISWLLSQPESVLSHEKANEDVHALPFLAPAFNNYDHLELIRAIRNDLTRNIASTEDALLEELERITDEVLGPAGDTAWREVSLTQALDKILFAVGLRVFFGPSLARDPKFLYYVKAFTRVTGALMILVSQYVAWPLKPLVGLIAGLPIYYYWIRLIILLHPAFKQRIKHLKTDKETAPADLITWVIDLASCQNPTKSIRISALVVRLTLIAFLPIDVLISMTQNFLLDLLTSDPKLEYSETLRTEAQTAFTSPQKSTHISQNMPKAESAIRESLRLSPLSDRMLSRRVVRSGGVTLPDGQFLPCGTWLGVAAVGVHRDERNYEAPDEYRPFRFVGRDEEGGEEGKGKGVLVPVTSERFLAFGHGRHSWLLVIGYILVNYEIEPLRGGRPENFLVGQTIIPPLGVKIRVRRRG